LPLVLAYGVLDDVLIQFISDDVFVCSGKFLGHRLAASKAALDWQDYLIVEEGKNARNALAHEAKLVSKSDCLRYIASIEVELGNWKLIDTSA
jgi:hypothetical protein